ncbi:MAG TPA: tetratricopeptide repeat protein [Candidatus Cloacimonadota bacterium]|nr:tetratricopeptide repeat protein [Candidatus Cloacimonadota bacterium]
MGDKELQNLLLRAETLMKQNWLHAVQLLNQAVDENPDDPRALIVLGNFYQTRQIFDKAIKCYQSALRLAPEDDHLKLIIGNSYFAEGDYDLAIVYYDQIKNPHPDVRYNKALALAYMYRHEESIDIMCELLDMIDNNPFIYFLLIEQLLRVGDHISAYQYIQRAEAKIGNHRHLLLLKALTYARMKNWLYAYNAFVSYTKLGKINLSEHLRVYAECAVQIGLPERGIPILEQGLELNPYDVGLYEELVRLLVQRGYAKRAREVLAIAKRYFRLTPVLKLLEARLNSQGD